MKNRLITLQGKVLSALFKNLHLGDGSTWPGHIALKINSHYISQMLAKSNVKIIIVAGTNGKTTTAKMIATILAQGNKKVMQNASGANLLNGISSTLLLHSTTRGQLTADYAIFEVDENALPLVLQEIQPDYLVLLNLFRDQLDRYGEVNTIADKWQTSLKNLSAKTKLIVNADDPLLVHISSGAKNTIRYFGLANIGSTTTLLSSADSLYCPKCHAKLQYSYVVFSHLGKWHCPVCKLKRPSNVLETFPYYPLEGNYNKYNTHAAVACTIEQGISEHEATEALKKVSPAFGRQEKIVINTKIIRIYLSKNPTGFNESLKTAKEKNAKYILFVLNDRIPDGRDVSWIWDTDIENILDGSEHIFTAGDRVYDMSLRIQYADFNNGQCTPLPDLAKGIQKIVSSMPDKETLAIIPTYSAMLEVRKILTGKKIL